LWLHGKKQLFAIDNIKVSGDAKLYQYTDDKDNVDGGSLFDKANSAADTALRLGVTGDLLKGVSFGMTANAVSTLGLENNLVSNTWTGAHGVTSAATGVDDAAWMSELWIATTMGKTTAKVGRMQLDTPLAFSETWSVAANTFDAAVLINQDIPDTTLVGAWVGKGNGVNHLSPLVPAKDNRAAVGIDAYMGAGAKMVTFGDQGAYAAAAVNNSWKPLTAQAWYYNVVNVADAYWLQADMNCVLIPGVKWGAQYADISTKGLAAGFHDSSAYALKAGYEGIEGLKLQLAYSDADNDGALKIANTATNNLGTAQSKLYTEAWWNYGYVGAAGAESVNVTAEYAASFAKFGAYYTAVDNDIVGSTANLDEVTLTASKSFGPLDTTLAYVSTDADDQNTGSQYDSVQVYLTLNF
jgi:hypothetical protein